MPHAICRSTRSTTVRTQYAISIDRRICTWRCSEPEVKAEIELVCIVREIRRRTEIRNGLMHTIPAGVPINELTWIPRNRAFSRNLVRDSGAVRNPEINQANSEVVIRIAKS
jgi:hypothetical protein